MRIAFVIGIFPAAAEAFIINQIADLADRGIEVEIFTFRKGSLEGVSQRYYDYSMADCTHVLEMPQSRIIRVLRAIPKIIRLLRYPQILRNLLFLNLRYIFWVEPFAGKQFDIVHCHFGPIALNYLEVKDIVGIPAKIVATFYGYDVSKIYQEQPADVYDRLIKESSIFFAMSENMKERMVKRGFPADRVDVLPASIDVSSYPFEERKMPINQPVHIMSVGRFVEKKGFDDLFRALAMVKEKSKIPFHATIIGAGPLENDLRKLVEDLKLHDTITWKGLMKIEDIIPLFLTAQLFVQPSKTAKNGDME